MKKLYFGFLILSLLLLAGCNNSGDLTIAPTSATAPVVVTEPPITAPYQDNISPDVPPTYENMYSIALPVNMEYRYSEDGMLLSRYASQSMNFIITDSEVAQKVKYDFYDRIEQNRLDAESIHELAQSMYENGTFKSALSYDVHYNVTRIDQGVLSLFGQIVQSGEGAQNGVPNVSANYNLVTGDVLTLGSILYHAECKETLADLIITKLDALTADIDLYQEYPDTVKKDFAKDESKYESFYFSTTGLCFYFPPYKVAPRVYGTIVVEIPYHELTGIISDDFFPAEKTYAKGDVSLSPFTTDEQGKYEQFAEIIAEENDTSVKIFLTTDSSIQNVRIFEIVRDGVGNVITQTKNIFAANILAPKDAILFEADFRSDLPRYVLSYTSDGTTKLFYFQADSNNQITLVSTNDSIQIRSGA